MKINLGIVGGGPTAIYFLKNLVDRLDNISQILHTVSIIEKESTVGIGMPYSEVYTEMCNMSNISSEEIPMLSQSLATWLQKQPLEKLAAYGIQSGDISETQIYPRLLLGKYFKNEYEHYKKVLLNANVCVKEYCNSEVVDILKENESFEIIIKNQKSVYCHTAVIASGHDWINEDTIKIGYFASPWPITKVLPSKGKYDNYTVGILGASLSAFDVVSSLSRRHGKYIQNGTEIEYIPDNHTEKFKMVMHDFNGWLPHLQYEQKEPMRQVYRHVTKKGLTDLIDEDGFLRLDTYFNLVCKAALSKAFYKDEMLDIVRLLNEEHFGILDFVKKMSELHEYPEAFKGMQEELVEAKHSVNEDDPIHWKEVTDDLMYTLNFHAELMSAEDHYIFNTAVMPFLLNVIAALPLESAKIMLALHRKGKLEMRKGAVTVLNTSSKNYTNTRIEVVDGESTEKISYKKFITCSGQKSITLDNFPFQSLVTSGSVRAARSKVADIKKMQKMLHGNNQYELIKNDKTWYMKLMGIDINANFQLIDSEGNSDSSVYNLSFTHTAGIRPYSYGLQACELSSRIVVEDLINGLKN